MTFLKENRIDDLPWKPEESGVLTGSWLFVDVWEHRICVSQHEKKVVRILRHFPCGQRKSFASITGKTAKVWFAQARAYSQAVRTTRERGGSTSNYTGSMWTTFAHGVGVCSRPRQSGLGIASSTRILGRYSTRRSISRRARPGGQKRPPPRKHERPADFHPSAPLKELTLW